MLIDVIKKGSNQAKIQNELEKVNHWTEVIIRPANGKPSSAFIASYYAKLRRVSLDQGIDPKTAHDLSLDAAGCIYIKGGKTTVINPFDFKSEEFKDYYNSVMWFWQSKVSIDLGVM